MGKNVVKICKDTYMIGGSGLSHPNDCSVYLIDAGDLVLIDCGAGNSFDQLISNIESTGLDPNKLTTILVTHRHIDHIGSLKRFKDDFGVQIIAHELDADAIESGIGTGADMYGVPYLPCTVDLKLGGEENKIQFGDIEIIAIHIPGHTDGSIAAYIDTPDGRVLFGQDIHGPYLPQWGADINKARQSLQKLIDLKADILCEGHFGIYKPATAVEKYIRGYLNNL
ncbi:MAG: MBL fold metallo-hydrolase [Chloroflexi bacterium]|nr:MBL fold metallo-hydrolase [Chloroflexota bacterium]